MITQKSLEKAKYLMEEDFIHYYNARLKEAEHFNETEAVKALISFEKGEKIDECCKIVGKNKEDYEKKGK